MHIIFNSSLGTHTLEVFPYDTIDNVKNKLKDKTGRDVSEISNPLDGTKTVESYGLKHENKLTAVFDVKDISIQVTLPSKKVLPVKMAADDIVCAVMKGIKQSTDINIADHQLVYQGRILQITDDLQQVNIVDGSELVLQEKNMQLRVILPTGADHNIEVPSVATIAELMITIQNITNVDVSSHYLKYRGQVLNIEDKLNVLGIGNNSVVFLKEKKLQLQIKLQNGKKIPVKIPVSADMENVLQKIEINTATDVSKHQLSYDEQVLNLTDKLQELNIADGSELTLQEADLHLEILLPDLKVMLCQVPADSTVEHVISNIKMCTDIDMSLHELVYKDKLLVETEQLSTLNILEATQLILRVRKIDLTVILPDTTSINVKVTVNDKVENVMKQIQTQCRSLQGSSFLLTYNSCTLDKNKQLHYCGVIHGAVLRVAARDVELRVRKEDEQSIAIKLPVTDTVKVAKQKIQDRMGHRVEDQRLSIFLHDNDTLLQSNIYHNIDVQLDTYGRDKLVSYKTGGWYKGYNEDTGRWEELIQYPKWRDVYTSGCAHPDGVILAGAKDHNTGNHVVLLNVRTKQTVPLPDLPHAVYAVGIVYNAGVLTLAGGKQSEDGRWKDSKKVYQLNVGGDGGWVKLPSLPHTPVYNPMLVCDDRYLYVLGGYGCKVCVKLDKNNQPQWTTFTDLPVECHNVVGGVLVINNTVLVMSPSRHMTLNTQTDTWTTQEYKDNNITRCTPVWYRDKVTASVCRGDGAQTVECYNSTTNSWSVLYRTDASAGAGMFLSVKY